MNIERVTGDLLDQNVDAIVNPWNRNLIPYWLLLPQGVSGAIKKRAGYRPFQELGYRSMALGSARHTSAGRLPLRAIIHVASINMLWRASGASITQCTHSAVQMAANRGYSSLAIPLLGAGSGGFNADQSEELIVNALSTRQEALEVTVVRYK